MKLGPILRQTASGGVVAVLIGSGLCCGRGDSSSGSGTARTTVTSALPVIQTKGGATWCRFPLALC